MTKQITDRIRRERYRELHTEAYYRGITRKRYRGKVCTVCEVWKPYADYPRLRTKADGFYGQCKECRSLALRRSRRKAAYGIDDEQYAVLMRRQQRACGICRQPHDERPLVVDHCHNSGEVRGLLCANCNNGLGHFRDRSDYLIGAIGYLARSSGYPHSAEGARDYLEGETA